MKTGQVRDAAQSGEEAAQQPRRGWAKAREAVYLQAPLLLPSVLPEEWVDAHVLMHYYDEARPGEQCSRYHAECKELSDACTGTTWA